MLHKIMNLGFHIEVMAGFRWMTPEDAALIWNGSADKTAVLNPNLVKSITTYMSFH
jgi:hypothetical protein